MLVINELRKIIKENKELFEDKWNEYFSNK